MDADAVKTAFVEAGMFAFIKQRPYDIIADPTVAPKGIFVSAFDTNPLAPEFEFAERRRSKLPDGSRCSRQDGKNLPEYQRKTKISSTDTGKERYNHRFRGTEPCR